jgi:hypothetical protein
MNPTEQVGPTMAIASPRLGERSGYLLGERGRAARVSDVLDLVDLGGEHGTPRVASTVPPDRQQVGRAR